MMISPVLAKILRAGRPQFNARVTEARHRYPAFKTEAFSAFLVSGLDPLVQAVAKAAPDYCSSVVVAAYDIALDLVGRDLAGPQIRSEHINRLWQNIFPALAVRVAENPQLVLGALSNALVNIESLPTARPGQWLELMQHTGPQAQSSEQLLHIGVVAAWRAGAAHFRQAALRAAADLPEELALKLIGVDKKISLSVLLQNLGSNPWWLLQLQSANQQALIKEVGAFSGFGGFFSAPPQVRAGEDGFVVKSGERCNLLIADAYGAVLLPASEAEFERAAKVLVGDSNKSGQPRLQGAQVTSSGKTLELSLPAKGLALAFNEHTLAVTSPYSFAITLIPR